MKVTEPHRRLFSLWGLIDRAHNRQIASRLPPGARVLDAGCGYGSLTAFLSAAGFECVGLDADRESLSVARRLFPAADLRAGTIEEVNDLEAGAFDAVVLKDVLHHLVGEGDPQVTLERLRHTLRPGGTLVVLDPNPTWILRTARRIVRHHDPEVRLGQAVELLEQTGFTVRGVGFYEMIGLGLSGGYVGPRLVPELKWLHALLAPANDVLSWAAVRTGLGRILCWRYIIQAERR